jgi:D-alanyl-D-alanine carboxypeptidase/D-alanyl-D-alanine-endopeptidase (penicillin-binding protein 4)
VGDGLRNAIAVIAVAVALLAGAAWLGFDAANDDALPADPTATATAEVAVPMWSLRRAPEAVATEAAVQQVQQLVTQTLPGTPHCLMVAEGDRVLGETDPDTPFTPASTQKLLTAAAALDVLGPDFTYTTQVFSTTQAGPDGALPDLFLVGSGDPVLVTPAYAATLADDATTVGHVRTPFEQFAAGLAQAGVRAINGPVAVDDARYDQLRVPRTWKESYVATPAVVGPIGALVVDHGFTATDGSDEQSGDPAITAGERLVQVLTDAGITVAGPVVRGTPPAGTQPIAQVTSPPLREILGSMLRESDNTIAEMITRELGLKVSNTPTTEAGAQAIVERVAALGVPTTGVALVDGSGLDRGNTATCRALLTTLDLADDPARPQFATLYEGLPIAGREGTLAGGLDGTSLVDRLRAKTGFIDGVGGLAGFVDRDDTQPPRRLRFAFIINANEPQQAVLSARIFVGGSITDWFLRALDPQRLAPA